MTCVYWLFLCINIQVSMSGFDDRLVNGGSILELIGKERRNGKSPEEVEKSYTRGI